MAKVRKGNPPTDKVSLVTIGGWAGAILAIAGVIGGVWTLAYPKQSVSVNLVNGSWVALGQSGTRYRYGFDIRFRNAGNRSIAMSERERGILRVCPGSTRRGDDIGEKIELVRHDSDGNLAINSMANNLLQVRVIGLPVPLLSSATAHIELLSPIHDLGGVALASENALFSVPPLPSSVEALCAN